MRAFSLLVTLMTAAALAAVPSPAAADPPILEIVKILYPSDDLSVSTGDDENTPASADDFFLRAGSHSSGDT
ncbi:hypothetical protein, partial [Acrocarpospora macrocephala]